jgi:hypothetical protein
MATTTTTPLRESTAPTREAPSPRKMRRRFATRHGVLTWAAVLAALAAAIALAVVTLTGGDDTSRVTGAHTGLIEHGSIRAHEGSVEDSVDPSVTDAHTGLVEHGSIRSIEGSVEDSVDPAVTDAHTGLIEHGSISANEGSVEDQPSCWGWECQNQRP